MTQTAGLEDSDRLRLLGRGEFDAGLFAALDAAEKRRRLLRLELVRRRAAEGNPAENLIGELVRRWFEVARDNIAAIEPVLTDPFVSIWSAGVMDDKVRIAALGGLARLLSPVVAADETLCGSLTTDATGAVHLPRYDGVLRTPAPDVVVDVRLDRPGGLVLECAHGRAVLRVGAPPTLAGALAWAPVTKLVSRARGHTFEVALVDRDPATREVGPTAVEVVDDAAIDRWTEIIGLAWATIAERHAVYAPGVSEICQAFVPQRPVRQGQHVSSTNANGYGAIGLSHTADVPTFAVAVIHETQHLKLSALLESVRLHEADAEARYYAGWRPDPRPFQALLHGVYAFSAVTEFWRAELAAAADPALRRRFSLEFALWAAQTSASVHELVESGMLTPEGRSFLAGIEDVAARWNVEGVEPIVRAAVDDIIAEHRLNWSLAAQLAPERRSTALVVHTHLQRTWRLRLLTTDPEIPTDLNQVDVALSAYAGGVDAAPLAAAIAAARSEPDAPTSWFRLARALVRADRAADADAVCDLLLRVGLRPPETRSAALREAAIDLSAYEPTRVVLTQPEREWSRAVDEPKLPVIDSDGHVVEPFDLWDRELPEEFRSVARQRTVDPGTGKEVLYHHGEALRLEWTIGTLATPGSGSVGGRLDHNIDTDVHPGINVPEDRLTVMDEQGLAVSVLFPSDTLGLDDVADVDFRWAYAQTYNTWVANFCTVNPVRLRWGAVIPLADVRRAIDEVDRCVALGASAVMLSPLPRSGPGKVPFESPERDGLCHNLGHADLDPLWTKLVGYDIPAVVHAVNPAANALGIGWVYANRLQWQMGQPWQLQMAMLHLIDGGTFDRFPELRVGFFEGDVGWLSHWLGRMEETYDKFALLSKPHIRRPIETFRSQCWISGEPADLGLAHTVELAGANRVLFASDWPHMDGAWPDPVAIVRDRDDLSEQDKRDILVEGPADFFRIDMDELMEHLGDGWSRTASVADLAGMLPPDYDPAIGTAPRSAP